METALFWIGWDPPTCGVDGHGGDVGTSLVESDTSASVFHLIR